MPQPAPVEPPKVSIDEAQARYYAEIVAGAHAVGPRGRIVFCVSTDDLDEGKGDPYVALGLGRYLVEEGWGVSLWPIRRWHERTAPEPDVAIVMLDSYIPGLLPQATATIAWVRNWTDTWAALPYLEEFDGVWASSPASAEALGTRYSGEVSVVPIGVDLQVFPSGDDDRPLPVVTTANFWGAERQIQSALTLVSESVPVVWFGANGAHLRRGAAITHADRVSFFGVGSVYRQSRVVVDDLIAAARAYGSHNSRLFEAIASGAVPITNQRAGLDYLGLGEVPTYDDDASLAATVHSLLEDDAAFRERAGRLQRVVFERHSFARRAQDVLPLIDAARERAGLRGPRPAMLVWAASERVRLQSAEALRDGHLITVRRLEREMDDLRASAEQCARDLRDLRARRDDLDSELRRIRSSRVHRVAQHVSDVIAGVRARGSRRTP